MTYQQWCEQSKEILKEAEEVNSWRITAQHRLLTELGPRIAKLGRMGCGFHYSMEQSFGKLIVTLSMPWQPSANWCQNVESDRDKYLIAQVIFDSLVEQIEKAEKTVFKNNR